MPPTETPLAASNEASPPSARTLAACQIVDRPTLDIIRREAIAAGAETAAGMARTLIVEAAERRKTIRELSAALPSGEASLPMPIQPPAPQPLAFPGSSPNPLAGCQS